MSNTERGDGAEQHNTNPDRPEQTDTNPTNTEPRTDPAEGAPEQAAGRLAQESRLRILRSKAAVARSEVDALAATHLDPDTLEDLLDAASPREAERLRKSEHEISERVARATAKAEAAEAEYEQAVLDDFDEAER